MPQRNLLQLHGNNRARLLRALTAIAFSFSKVLQEGDRVLCALPVVGVFGSGSKICTSWEILSLIL